MIAGFGCALAGLCYAEFAAMIPVSGSAYSYSYATLGECVAWFIGWNLVLEYLFAAATVAVGWSRILRQACSTQLRHRRCPPALTNAPLDQGHGQLQIVRTGAMHQPAGGADRRRRHCALLRRHPAVGDASTRSWSRSRSP